MFRECIELIVVVVSFFVYCQVIKSYKTKCESLNLPPLAKDGSKTEKSVPMPLFNVPYALLITFCTVNLVNSIHFLVL